MPEQGVSPNKQAILRRKVHDLLTTVKGELPAAGFRTVPLHAVLGRDLTECGLNGRCVLGILKEIGVGDCAEVLLALGNEEVVEVGNFLTSGGCGRSKAGGQKSSCDGLHLGKTEVTDWAKYVLTKGMDEALWVVEVAGLKKLLRAKRAVCREDLSSYIPGQLHRISAAFALTVLTSRTKRCSLNPPWFGPLDRGFPDPSQC